MATVNALNPSIDRTVQIFDRFYSYQQSVSAVEYDVVYSYFRSVFSTKQQAGNFTVTLFRIANLSNTPVMTLLQSMKGLSKPQITLNFAYYLNTVQSPSTMMGIQVPITPNYYAARNVKQ
jgi:pyruvate/2-oxoacid:ferredoxin oxidoreductase alpha subunit